jgi:hypothetical protein
MTLKDSIETAIGHARRTSSGKGFSFQRNSSLRRVLVMTNDSPEDVFEAEFPGK